MNTPRSTVGVCIDVVCVHVPLLVCPLITAQICSKNHPVQLSTCSPSDLNSNREQ